MAFVSGNLGKEILQKAMKNANTNIRPKTASIKIQKPTPKPSQRENSNQSPIVPKIDTLATRASSNPKIDEPMQSPTLLPYRNIPNEHVKCSCNVCQEKNGIKIKPQTAQAVAKPRMNVQEGNNKGFSHLLKLMLPDRGNAPKGLKFLIADTLVFTGGEPRFFMYNSRNKYIRFIKQKDKLALPEMKKFFLSRKQRKELDGLNFFNENTMTMKHKIQDWKQKAREERETERYFGAYEKSHNQGNSPSRKEKRVQDSTAHREIVICKYTDESLQVLSELDFSYLMMKRKIEAVWLTLDYIQSYIKLKKEHPYYVRVDYDHDRDIKNPFYERAREFVYYMSQEREPELEGFDYTTAEDIFEEDLKKANIFEYCQYLNFKFVCYLDAYCATRVKHMITEYAWEETNLVYLVNAYDIRFFNIAEQDYILREVDIVNDEEKQKANDRIYNNKSSPYQGKVEVLWAFRQYYEDMKSDLDINKEFEETILENPTSNEAFKIINPETAFTLYDVMTNVKEFEKFKGWLQNRSMEPGKLGKLFKSALKFAETSATANMSKASAATKIQKSSSHRLTNRNEPSNDNAAKLFQKKMKILDICGNGVSRKKYIHTSEVLYRSDVVSGRKIIALDSTTTRSKMTSPMISDQSTGRGLTATPSRQFRIRSQKTPTPGAGANGNSGFDFSILGKNKSLASMLYLKPDQL